MSLRLPPCPHPQLASKRQDRVRGELPVDPRVPCSPPRQGSPALSHAHAIWVIWSSHYHAHTIPVGCHSDNTPSDSSSAEAAIGKSLLDSPSAVIPEDAAPEVTLGSAELLAEGQRDFAVCLRLLHIARGSASDLNLLQRCLSALFPAELRSLLQKVEWMCFPPDMPCWADATPYGWWRWLLSFKENRKKQPKYVSNSHSYILESKKKNNSCLVDLYRCLEVIWSDLSQRWSSVPCSSGRGHRTPLCPHPLETQLLLGAALKASFTSNNQCMKVKASLQYSRGYTDESKSRNCPAASVFLITMQKPGKNSASLWIPSESSGLQLRWGKDLYVFETEHIKNQNP